MEDLLVKYGIIFGKRYNLKQRQRFLMALSKEFEDLDYKVKFANNNRKNNGKAVDLFVGDIGSASTIICTHHDTPLKVLWPNYRHYPLNGQRSFRVHSIVTLVPTILATVVGAFAIYYLISNPNFGGDYRTFWMFLTVLGSFLLATLISKGMSNKYNINRNTASVLAILEAAEKLSKQARQKTAFIFLDKGCSDNSGAQMLQQALPTTLNKKLFIYLDCIGNGDNFIIAPRENLKRDSEKLLKNFTGKQKASIAELDDAQVMYTPAFFFKRCIVLTNGKFDKLGNIYVDKVNSNADKIVDIETVEAVGKMLADSFNK